MARHNREGTGEDQHGRRFVVAYQPDWFHQAKVTRTLPNGRQSTKTLVRNPEPPAQEPGARVRTHVRSEELGLDFEVVLQDPRQVVRRVVVETVVPQGEELGQVIAFTLSRFSEEGEGAED